MLATVEINNRRFTFQSELNPLCEMLGQRFFPRRDIQARQLEDGRYICIHKPLRVKHLEKHLRGELTLGAYLLDENSRAQFIVLDADDEKGFRASDAHHPNAGGR